MSPEFFGGNGLGPNPARVEGQGGISIRPPSQAFLENLATFSGIAGVASFVSPGGQTGVVVFSIIGVSSSLLNSYLYSNNQGYDAFVESIKMIVPVKEPFNLLSDPLIDIGAEALKKNLQSCGEEN